MTASRPPGIPGRSDRERTSDPQAVLRAFDDDDCRAILEAVAEEARTAAELAAACDVPTSTLYRKLDLLTDAGLLAERVRVRESGDHASEYQQCFENVRVAVDDDGFEVGVDYGNTTDRAALGAD